MRSSLQEFLNSQPIRVFNVPYISPDSGVTYSSPNPLAAQKPRWPRAGPAGSGRGQAGSPKQGSAYWCPAASQSPPCPQPSARPRPRRHGTQRRPSLAASCVKLPVPGQGALPGITPADHCWILGCQRPRPWAWHCKDSTDSWLAVRRCQRRPSSPARARSDTLRTARGPC